MKEIVINVCYGGFGLSKEAIEKYLELKNLTFEIKKHKYFKNDTYYEVNGQYFSDTNIKRDDEILIKVIKELGKKSYGNHAELKITEIPDDVDWEIEEYDGLESVHENHRTWC